MVGVGGSSPPSPTKNSLKKSHLDNTSSGFFYAHPSDQGFGGQNVALFMADFLQSILIKILVAIFEPHDVHYNRPLLLTTTPALPNHSL